MKHTQLDAEKSKARMMEMLDRDIPVVLMFIDDEDKIGYMSSAVTAAHLSAFQNIHSNFAARIMGPFVEQYINLHMAGNMLLDLGPDMLAEVKKLRDFESLDEEGFNAVLDNITATALKLDVLTIPLKGRPDETQDETPDDGDGSPEPPHTVDGGGAGDCSGEVRMDTSDSGEPSGSLPVPPEG